MSTRRQDLTLPLQAEEARFVIENVAGELGWAVTRSDAGSFEVREDPTRLHCHCSPLRATLSLTPSGGRTELGIEGEVPGRGPVASKHVREQTDLLARRVGLAALAVSRSAASSAARG